MPMPQHEGHIDRTIIPARNARINQPIMYRERTDLLHGVPFAFKPTAIYPTIVFGVTESSFDGLGVPSEPEPLPFG
jgi:hypothetical protein